VGQVGEEVDPAVAIGRARALAVECGGAVAVCGTHYLLSYARR